MWRRKIKESAREACAHEACARGPRRIAFVVVPLAPSRRARPRAALRRPARARARRASRGRAPRAGRVAAAARPRRRRARVRPARALLRPPGTGCAGRSGRAACAMARGAPGARRRGRVDVGARARAALGGAHARARQSGWKRGSSVTVCCRVIHQYVHRTRGRRRRLRRAKGARRRAGRAPRAAASSVRSCCIGMRDGGERERGERDAYDCDFRVACKTLRTAVTRRIFPHVFAVNAPFRGSPPPPPLHRTHPAPFRFPRPALSLGG